MIEDRGRAYKQAPKQIKWAFNQAIFEKILVYADGELEPEYAEPFNILLDLTNSGIKYIASAKTNVMAEADNCSQKTRNPDQSNFFDQGFIKRLLVALSDTDTSYYDSEL